MTTIRPYDHATDYDRIYRFLVDACQPGTTSTNWLAPRWEYMHFHPFILGLPLESIGVAEEDGEIVGIAHFEASQAFGYFQIRPGHEAVGPQLFDHAEQAFGGWSRSLNRNVRGLYIDQGRTELAALAADRGYRLHGDFVEEHSRFVLDRPIPEVELPSGFRLQSLAEENDLAKVNRVLWRGFDHKGPPSDSELPGRRMAQSAPNYRKDLTIVAVAPNGDYASFGGMWVVPENRVAYVEPVATDPDYRRMGLGRAVVLETLRRAAAEGADAAWVGSGQEFYFALGFAKLYQSNLWLRYLD